VRDPFGSTFAGPHQVACAEIFEGHIKSLFVEMGDVKEQAPTCRFQAVGVPPLRQTSVNNARITQYIHELLHSVLPKSRFDYLAPHHQAGCLRCKNFHCGMFHVKFFCVF